MTNTVYVIAPSAEQAAQISFAGPPEASYSTLDGAQERLDLIAEEFPALAKVSKSKIWEVTITTEAKEATR